MWEILCFCSGVAKVYFSTECEAVSLVLWFQSDTASYAKRTKTSVDIWIVCKEFCTVEG